MYAGCSSGVADAEAVVRVLMVSAHGADPTYGGAERYVRELASGLGARGHEVAVLSAFPQRGEPDVETHVLHRTDWRDDQVRRLRNHVGDLVSAPWPRARGVLDDLRPDLVHTNNLPGIGTGIWEVSRRAATPVVHTIHDHYLLCPRTTLVRRDGSPCRPHPLLCGTRTRRLSRWHRGVGAVVGPSEYILRAHRDLFATTPGHIVHHPLRSTGVSRAKPVDTLPRRLGYMGALTPVKGVRLLLAAAPSLVAQGFTLRIAGDGPLAHEVQSAEHIDYVGRLREETLADFVGSCDAGLVSSQCPEGSARPYVVCDWLSAGRPVLATRRGALIEAARGGGVLTFADSPTGLVEALLGLRAGGEWRRLCATVPVVEEDADVRRWLDQHEAVVRGRCSDQPKSGVIDTHCHLLPATDDGPQSLRDSLALARRLVDVGVSTVICTPHFSRRFPTDHDLARERTETLRGALLEAELPLRIELAAEVGSAAGARGTAGRPPAAPARRRPFAGGARARDGGRNRRSGSRAPRRDRPRARVRAPRALPRGALSAAGARFGARCGRRDPDGRAKPDRTLGQRDRRRRLAAARLGPGRPARQRRASC